MKLSWKGTAVLAVFGLFGLCATGTAQPLTKSAIQVDAGNTKATGAQFGYRLTYNCSSTSGPCLNAEVVDLLPPEVVLDSTVPSSPTGDVAAIQTTPNFGGSGRTRVRFVMINPLPAGNSGDLIINVRFPNGSTPNGTVATNTADAINLGATPGTITTPPVDVTAVATPQINLSKALNTSPANLDLPETYRIALQVPNSVGALNLTAIGPVTDTLPPGTVFNGATPAADCQPGCVGTTPATVTWTAPCSTPLAPNNTCAILVNVTFPSATFPSGTNVTNTVTAEVTPLGEPPRTVGPAGATHAVTAFVPAPGMTLQKLVNGNGPNPPTLNQNFAYDLQFNNSGNVPLDNLVVIDTLPVEMQVVSVTTGAYNGLANFAAGEGVRVSYEKNTALGVFTLWGSSPNTTTNTTLTAPPPGLGAGEYVTRVRWEFGQAQPGMAATGGSTRPLVTGRIVNPDNAGGPVAIGDTIQNCLDLSAVYTAGPTNVTRNACRSFVLSGPFAQLNPGKETIGGGGPFNPGQAINYRLRVRSDARSSDPVALQSLVATDLLPVDLLFTSWTFDDQGTGLPAPQGFDQIPNFAGTGRTLLRWRWNAGSGNLGVGQEVRINIGTTVRNGAAAGALPNDFTLEHDAPGLVQRCSAGQVADTFDFDGDGDSAETLCRSQVSVTISGIAQLISSKTIQGTCDGGSVAASLGTLTGGGIEYRLRVQNVGTVPMQDFVLIDILPFVGDTGVRDTSARGSQWTPLLAAPIVPPAGTTLYYSTSGNPCRGEVGGPTTSCDAPGWSTVAPEPITAARSFKLEFNDRVVNPFDFVQFTFVMTTPGSVPAGATAYNSFAYQASRADGLGALAAEPQKVGIALGSCEAASLGDFVWIDVNDNGVQDDGATGLNGVRMELLAPGGDGVPGTLDDVPLDATLTGDGPGGEPGWYRFPGLAPGNYLVRALRPPNFEFAQRDAGGDAADSDVDALGRTPVTNLSTNEDDPTLDVGLVATAFGAAGDYAWFDRDADGMQNEPVDDGVNGVRVSLHLDDGDGNPEPASDPFVASTVTADDESGRPGYYLFEGLVPDLPYFIVFDTPAAASGLTVPDAGGGDAQDSDPDANGATPVFSVAALETDRSFDVGFVAPSGTLALGDQVWLDTDNDGSFEPQDGETGIDGVRLDLYRDVNGDGEPTLDEFSASTVSATSAGFAGRYRFDGLAPGTYLVVVPLSNFGGGGALAGLASSSGNDPAPDPDDDANGDDNGTDIGALLASRAVTLTDNGEPTSEDGNNDSNLTVDFGFTPLAAAPPFDYGDAPDSGAGTGVLDYATTALDAGPRHALLVGAPRLGACVDADTGFAQDAQALGDDLAAGDPSDCVGPDDEDGVTMPGSFTPGGNASFSVTAGVAACALDAWADWNGDGDFADAGEQIATGLAVPTGAPTVLTPAVPADARPGTTYARFRCSTAGGLPPTGAAADGEVEDHLVTLTGFDFGDAPASYGDARHTVDPLTGRMLGQCVDTENATQPSAAADGDDAAVGSSRVGTACFDDEDGVVFGAAMAACQTGQATIDANAAGLLDGWIDFNHDGDFGDAGEHIFASQALAAGSNALAFNVPCTALEGSTYARLRLSAGGGTAPTGDAPDGEVEDLRLALGAVDFGDAPDSYGTLIGSSGPHHVSLAGFTLGATLDTEPNGQPGVGADGDGADEDGFSVPGARTACRTSSMGVSLANTAGIATPRLDAWLDFDGDGSFDSPRDRIATSLPLVAGANALPVSVPCDAAGTATYLRLRLSSAGTATPLGAAADGEVEDHAVVLQALDFGDLPDGLAGLASSDYRTVQRGGGDNGPQHRIVAGLRLGALLDNEADGQPANLMATGDDLAGDDEDGVTAAALVFTTGTPARLPVAALNSTGAAGRLCGYVDFNGDGDFDDANESADAAVPDGTAGDVLLDFGTLDADPAAYGATPPSAARHVRLRLFGDGAACTPDNDATLRTGEVEDHVASLRTPVDHGDAPESYGTLAPAGAAHPLRPDLRLGACTDAEASGAPGTGADGDDLAVGQSQGICATAGDDEDGFDPAQSAFRIGGPSARSVEATNATGGPARLCAFADWNADGDFADAGEATETAVPDGTAGAVGIDFGAVPTTAAQGTSYLRLRLSTDAACAAAGFGAAGEVEDHAIVLQRYDFGDLPDAAAGTGTGNYATRAADGGALHRIVAGLRLGAALDGEGDGQPNPAANGDDLAADDEDGIVFPPEFDLGSPARVQAAATNLLTAAAQLCGWIDWNDDGDFADAQEATSLAVPAGSDALALTLDFGPVPANAVADPYARFRLSTAACSVGGEAPDGEVEDYRLSTSGVGAIALGDLVFDDRNNNCLADPGEAGLAGIAVRLFLDADGNGVADGAAIAGTSTDADGRYGFADLLPGTYFVEIDRPAQYVSSSGGGLPYAASGACEPAPDADDDVDGDDNGSNAGGALVRSAPITLEPELKPGPPDSDSNPRVDFGLLTNFDLALAKTLAPDQSPVVPGGSVVRYLITLTNQGTVPATQIVVTDRLPHFTTLDDAAWSAGPDHTAVRTVAALAPGASIELPIQLQVGDFDGALVNMAQITSALDGDGEPPLDIDSTPGNAAEGEDDQSSAIIVSSSAPRPIPAAQAWTLMLLAALLLLFAPAASRRRPG